MNNKELLLEAINHYAVYSPSEKTILKLFVKIAVDDIIISKVVDLCKLTNLRKSIVYKSLSNLEKTNTIIRLNGSNKRIKTFQINKNQLNYILEIYQNFIQFKR